MKHNRRKEQSARLAAPRPRVAPAWRWLPMAAGAIFLLLASHAAWVETPTIDEFAHVPAGCAYWHHGRFSLYAENPPLWKMMMAAPLLLAGAETPEPVGNITAWDYGYMFAEVNTERYFTLFWLARMTTVLATLSCGFVLWLWARELFDERAAGITAALFYLNPNILAHGHLATIDAACMLTILLALYTLSWACRRPGRWRMAVAGLAWGAALLTKFTAVLLLPVLPVLLLIRRWRLWRSFAADSVLLLVVALLIVNLGMGLEGSFTRLESFVMTSSFGRSLQQSLPGWVSVPLPRSYVEGFDQQKRDTEQGEFGSYLFGAWSDSGWWYYNLVALVVKNPLLVVVLVIVGPWFWPRRPQHRPVAEIAVPLVVLLASMTLFNQLNIGVRYLLPIFPLALLLAAAVWRGQQRWQRWLAPLVLLLHAGTAARLHPAYLSYFNLAVGGPGRGHHVLLDSNLDWGQDLYRVPSALAQIGYHGPVALLYFGHVPPKLYGIDYQLPPPRSIEGVLAVSLQYLMGGSYLALGPGGRMYDIPPDYIAWLRQYPPRLKAGSIWIFDTRGPRG